MEGLPDLLIEANEYTQANKKELTLRKREKRKDTKA